MKPVYRISLIIFAICCHLAVLAQKADPDVHFSAGRFSTGNNIRMQKFTKDSISSGAFGGHYYLLVQFDALPSRSLRENLKRAGVELHTFLPGNAYLATVNRDFNFTLARSFNLSSINIVPAFYKLHPALLNERSARDNKGGRMIAVSFYPGIDPLTVQQQLQLAGATIVPTKYDRDQVIFIEVPGMRVINAIASLPFISSMRPQPILDKPLNYNSIGAHGISGLQAPNGKNLNGKGVAIGIGDNADISTHVDFSARLINRSPWKPADHGTHVAGTAGGAGIINVKNHGVAPRATLINQYFSDIITNAPTYVVDNNMVLTNNSYYSVDDGCAGTGEYDVLSNYIDRQSGTYPQLLHVVASGNDGVNTCSPYPPGYGTVKSGWQSAKNVLTVGAMNTDDYSIANFSSRGPLKDGRLKPEITTGGWAITSTTTNNGYGLNYGTSMASPVATGTLALMYERYRQTHGGANPKSALMKALVCNTAEDLGNAGPDFTFGFGMLNARRAVEAIDSNRYFINTVATSGNNMHGITVPANTRRVKIMLYWNDSAASTSAAIALVNDLDLTVTGPDAILHRPLVLNAAAAGVSSIATEGADHINNIEQVVIENPVAGTYSIRVNGFAVPFGSQEYIITYEIIRPSVTVEYPFGGEKLVPGETENIRWSAYGNELNNFTLEYSINNGAAWTTISNNVAAASRKYPWSVPAGIATAQALVRVSRNGTLLSDQSDFNFSVLGSPVLTATNVCEGAVQLNWGAITGATSYDILQLNGDSMQVVGNTAALSFVVKGMKKDTVAWLGVAARNGGLSGRRSVSVNALPSSGPCTLATFNNDLKVDSILEPNSARQGFANAGNAIKPVKVLIRNLGAVAVSGPYNVSYRYLNTTVTEIVNASIPARGSIVYTFTGTYPIVAAGYRYDFSAWAALTSDGNHSNDTAYKVVKYINNDAITAMPVTESFETMPAYSFTRPEMAIGDNKRVDFAASSARGRVRSFVNTGFSFSGTKAMTLDQAPFSDSTNTDSLTLSYNLSNYASRQLRMDFYYKNHGQENGAGNKVWLRGSQNNSWVQAYDLLASQAALGSWKRSIVNINEVLAAALPPQSITSTFQVKIGEEGNTSANTPRPVTGIDDGYTIDDITLNEALNDVGLAMINSPDISGCSLSATNPIGIKIKNYNNVTLNNVPVSYQVNGGAVITENIASIAPNQTLDYVFTQAANLSAFIDYSINVWVKYPGDSYAVNDSIINFSVHNSPLISNYPYLQNFEVNDGFFYTAGTNSSWQYGTPSKTLINKAASGSKAWVTSLTQNYNNDETSYLYSPCFDMSGLAQPVLSFSHILTTELNFDYSWVEYSTDGIAWNKLGVTGTGTNWYDDASTISWGGGNTRWHVASTNLPALGSTIRFRFVLSSDGGVTEEGVGIDDIHVFDKAPVYTGPPLTGISQNVNGSNWVDFMSGGSKIVSMNSNGADLGLTSIQVHPYSGSVRNSNNQYYANRNIVIRTTRPATANVGVRFYFTEAEAQNLVDAQGCSTCSKPADPYELGIAKYNGSNKDENGILEDDTTGFFQYILPAATEIVPFDNGYYAAFSVSSFSEFWLSGGNIRPSSGGICPGETILFTAAEGWSSYQWQEDRGSGFVNISDGARYVGTATPSLQVINVPGSFAGYRYRCLTNGIVNNTNAIRFTNTWNGTISNNWFVSGNWSCGSVPDQYTNVVIPGGLAIYPLINASTTVRSVSVHPGANVTAAAGVTMLITRR